MKDLKNFVVPKISIVTPSYNQGQFIESAIQSVLLQDYPNFEHIIIDNCSDDQTIKIVKKYPHLIFISEPDKGQSDALNKGFKIALGDFIGWLNSDDYYLPNCFEKIVDFFNNTPDCDILYGDYRWIDEENNVVQIRREIDFNLFILKYLHVLYIPTTATFFRKKIFRDQNFLDVSLSYAMDYEFFLRLALKNYKFYHFNDFLADFRWHCLSKSSQFNHDQYNEQYKALLKYDKFLKMIPAPFQKVTKKMLEYFARGQRYIIKGSQGFYWDQWQLKK